MTKSVNRDETAYRERHFGLVARCVDLDRRAWDEFVREFTGLVYFAIAHAARRRQAQLDDDTVADLHNAIFLSFLEDDCRRLRQFSGRCSVSNWIKVVAVNATIDHLRRRRPEILSDELPEQIPAAYRELLNEVDSPEEQLSDRQRSDQLQRALAQLTSQERLFVEYFYRDGLDLPQIAAIFGISAGAVYARKHRVLKKIGHLVLDDTGERQIAADNPSDRSTAPNCED
ncbi:MAG: sigma-70 family RNA polymerase sigma factor [Myxococcales bacterium]|nr:sigma-70 family RNA polymerase sigma factor [Myxococcales bacterium]